MAPHDPALYDLGPLALVMLTGALLALGPLLWVWRRHAGSSSARKRHALTVLTLFLTFDLVLFGAFTRLTDSGLGCPDWPGCYGSASPLGASTEIASAQSALPSGPVTRGKAWIEMIHRYLATGVGALILVLAAWAWRERAGRVPWLAFFTLFWVCLQGAFGALTVTMKLFPAIVTLHLLGGLVLLALLVMQTQPQAARSAVVTAALVSPGLKPALRRLAGLTFALLMLQSALGAWVSTNYAVLACRDFPTCQGVWWPEMNFAQGFELWRPLGLSSRGEPISFAALTAIHYVHRAMAALVLTLLGVLAWRLNRLPAFRIHSRWLAGLLGLQLATGMANVVLGWPLLAAVLHTGGAAALVMVMTWTLMADRSGTAARIAA
jgi:cytochrome c oxidase assembly protein subunit 15